MAPQKTCLCKIPVQCVNEMLLGKYIFSDATKLQILRSEYPALSEWSPIPKTNVLIKKTGDGEPKGRT